MKRRWRIETGRWYANIVHQVLVNGRWRYAVKYYGVCISRRWQLGADHAWYDGPHCQLGLGWVKFNWSSGHCDKCEVTS